MPEQHSAPKWWKWAVALAASGTIIAAAVYLHSASGDAQRNLEQRRLELGRGAAVAETATPSPTALVAASVSQSNSSPSAPPPARSGIIHPAQGVVLGETLQQTIERVRPEVAVAQPELTRYLDALLSSLPEERTHAVAELGFQGDLRIIAPIIQLLGTDPVAGVRSAAATALETHDDSPAIATALVGALKDRSEEVRENAMLSLKAQRTSAVERELRIALANGDLDEPTQLEARLFLDRYYARKDPFKNPLEP